VFFKSIGFEASILLKGIGRTGRKRSGALESWEEASLHELTSYSRLLQPVVFHRRRAQCQEPLPLSDHCLTTLVPHLWAMCR
jgi:hypothetical protein